MDLVVGAPEAAPAPATPPVAAEAGGGHASSMQGMETPILSEIEAKETTENGEPGGDTREPLH